jgi:KaiC/GvpD/RAD55 family RecA-like ATPase
MAGADQMIRPGSTSGVPGLNLLGDGLKVYSHGADALNDGHAHDSFDILRILKCDGSFGRAINYIKEWVRASDLEDSEPEVKATGTSSKYRRRSKAVRVADLKYDRPQWLLKNTLAEHEVGIVYGPSGVGKSFLALDLACAIADPAVKKWDGISVATRPVYYVNLEGQGGFRERIKAYQIAKQAAGVPVDLEDMWLREKDFELNERNGVDDVLADIEEFGIQDPVIIVDTLAQATPGMDENKSDGMGLVLQSCNRLRHEGNATVIIIHHSGKDETRGLRGHSSLKGAVSGVIQVNRDEVGNRFWQKEKVKDAAADPDKHYFEMAEVFFGTDEDGDEVGSAVVHHVVEAPRAESKFKQVSKAGEAALFAMKTALKDRGISAWEGNLKPGVAGVETVVRMDDFREAFYDLGPYDKDSKRVRFSEGRKELRKWNMFDSFEAKDGSGEETEYVWLNPLARPEWLGPMEIRWGHERNEGRWTLPKPTTSITLE